METNGTSETAPQQEKDNEQQSKEYGSKWSAKFYKIFSLLSFFVYYVNCSVRIVTRAADYYRSKGADSFVSYLRIAFDASLWGEAAREVFDWYTVTLLVFLLVYAIVFFIIFAKFSPKRKKTFKYFKKSFSLARKFLKVINIALTLVVLINTAKLTSDDAAGKGDKFTFAISVFSLLFSLIQIALSIATWVITSKIKKKYKNYKQTVSGVSYVVGRYLSPQFKRRRLSKATQEGSDEGQHAITEATAEGDAEQAAQIQTENNGDIGQMDKKTKPKTTIAEKLGKIKSRFLRTLAALSLTDREADEAMKEREAQEKEYEQDSTERFESDYSKNASEDNSHESDNANRDEPAADIIVPDEKSVTISVDEEYVERYKRRKAEKRQESVEDIKKKLGDFGDKVDEAGNKLTDNIKKAYRKVKSKIRPVKNKSDGSGASSATEEKTSDDVVKNNGADEGQN